MAGELFRAYDSVIPMFLSTYWRATNAVYLLTLSTCLMADICASRFNCFFPVTFGDGRTDKRTYTIYDSITHRSTPFNRCKNSLIGASWFLSYDYWQSKLQGQVSAGRMWRERNDGSKLNWTSRTKATRCRTLQYKMVAVRRLTDVENLREERHRRHRDEGSIPHFDSGNGSSPNIFWETWIKINIFKCCVCFF